MNDTAQLDVDARRLILLLFVALVGVEVFFVLADAIINVGRLTELGPVRRFFNITREDGVASWFATTQTWMLGLTAAFIFVLVRAGDAVRWRRLGCAIIAVFLLYMAMDDGSKFHERIGSSVKDIFQSDDADSGSRRSVSSRAIRGSSCSCRFSLRSACFCCGF